MEPLYPHQQKAVDQLSNGKILRGDTGVGKSRAALAYFYTKVCGGVLGDMGSMKTPMDLYIITTARKRDTLDWETEALPFNIGKERGASVSGIKMTIDSWNNIKNYEDVENAFFIFDEQRLVGGGAWVKFFLKIVKKNQWIMLTATPGDTWLDYVPVFIANGFYKNRTEFKLRHIVYNQYVKYPKVDRYVDVGHLVRLRHKIIVDMPYLRATIQLTKEVIVKHNEEVFERVRKKRWNVYENKPLKDVAELFRVMRKVVNSDPSRLKFIRDLMKEQPKLIVFYNFDYELDILRTLKDDCWNLSLEYPGQTFQVAEFSSPGLGEVMRSKSGSVRSYETRFPLNLALLDPDERQAVMEGNPVAALSENASPETNVLETTQIAEWNGHKHEEIPKTDRWVYLVQYAAGSEAWNCTETDVIVFYSLTYSYRNFHQAKGRIDRLNTRYCELYYYVLRSKSWIDDMIWEALTRKKNFNEPKSMSEL